MEADEEAGDQGDGTKTQNVGGGGGAGGRVTAANPSRVCAGHGT